MSAALEPTIWNRSPKVIIPKAMAYAMMAGLPVQVGLYTALVTLVIYAILGTTWAVVAFAGVVFVRTMEGVVVAIIVSLVTLADQVANPPVYVLRRKPGTNAVAKGSLKDSGRRTDEAQSRVLVTASITWPRLLSVTGKSRPINRWQHRLKRERLTYSERKNAHERVWMEGL